LERSVGNLKLEKREVGPGHLQLRGLEFSGKISITLKNVVFKVAKILKKKRKEE